MKDDNHNHSKRPKDAEIHINFDEPVERGGTKYVFIVHGKKYVMDASKFRKVVDKGLVMMNCADDWCEVVDPNY
jgi:hypothetical protein